MRHTCEYVDASDIVPEGWRCWFWDRLSDGAPFTWGDNNRSLVTASRLLDHARSVIDVDEVEATQSEVDEFFELLEELGETYIDLEN